MNILLAVLCYAVVLPTICSAQNTIQQSNTGTYGDAIPNDIEVQSLDDALSSNIVDELVVVSCTVSDVNADDGKWMIVTSDSGTVVSVVTKGHSFSVPSSLRGKTVLIYGRLTKHVISEEDRIHVATEREASSEELRAIHGNATLYQLTANGVSEQ